MTELSFASVSILFVTLSHVYGTNVGAAMSPWLMAINCYSTEANNRETTRRVAPIGKRTRKSTEWRTACTAFKERSL